MLAAALARGASTAKAKCGLGTLRWMGSTRHHVNPLQSRLLEPLAPIKWSQHFADPALPVHLDIGCGNGELVRNLAENNPGCNYIGVDIRDSYVRDALRVEPHLPNLHYVQANLTFNAAPVLDTLPKLVQSLSIMYPDPWFKPKHHKRRLMNVEFLGAIAPFVQQGAPLHFQTDSFDLFTEAEELLMNNPYFLRQVPDPTESPFATTTYFQRRTVHLESRNEFMLLALRS